MCLCLGRLHGGKVVVPTYVDDCHIIGKTREGVQHIKAELLKRFNLRDLGPTTGSLALTFSITTHSTRHITLSQHQYIIDMLKDFGMEDCAPVKTPMVLVCTWRSLLSHSVLRRLSS
jgi:hypothetical protein